MLGPKFLGSPLPMPVSIQNTRSLPIRWKGDQKDIFFTLSYSVLVFSHLSVKILFSTVKIVKKMLSFILGASLNTTFQSYRIVKVSFKNQIFNEKGAWVVGSKAQSANYCCVPRLQTPRQLRSGVWRFSVNMGSVEVFYHMVERKWKWSNIKALERLKCEILCKNIYYVKIVY